MITNQRNRLLRHLCAKRTWLTAAFAATALLLPAKTVQRPLTITTHGAATTVALQFYAPGIVRVAKYPASNKEMPQKKSYSVILTPDCPNVNQQWLGSKLRLSSDRLCVELDTLSAQLIFMNAQGDTLLREKGNATFQTRQGDADAGKLRVSQTFTLDANEAIFGLGQLRSTAMNQRGQHVDIWNHNTYISIPYITSEKGYGLYWDNAGRSRFDDSDQGMTFSSEVALLSDYYFLYNDGTQDGVTAAIRTLTGQATMFPLWTMGHWQCRERYKTSDELCEVLDRYRNLEIPLDAIVQDWQYWGCDSNWNAMRFMNPYYINKVGDPEWEKYLPGDMRNMKQQSEPRIKSPQEMVNYVHKNNAHLMISIWANFGPWTEPYQKMKELGALLPFDTWPRNQGVMPYDPFNPKARDAYWHYLTTLYDMGFDAWWTDSTEPDHFEKAGDDDVMTHDGTWRSVKNAFPLMTNKGIYEHQRRMKGNHKRSVQMTRSGSFGLQHYATFSWSGDIKASWREMKNQIPSGLNYTLCGIPFWNTDLGGFFYWEYEQNPHNPALQELQTRWMQWGTFMPLMRNHCSSPMVSEIYQFGSKGDWAYDAMVDAIKLRYHLLPYIYSTAGDAVLNSASMMRPLVMDFPQDKHAINLNDEYLFGRNILVKPVTDPLYTWKDAQGRGHEIYPNIPQASAPVKVYLPKGAKWYDFWTNELLEGGRDTLRPCPINIMPVYIKAGTVMPFGPEVQYSAQKTWEELEIRIYPGDNGSFTLYEDEGDNYNYEKGQYSLIQFDYDDQHKRLTIRKRQGQFKGMLKNRCFNIVVIDRNSGSGHLPMNAKQTVQYNGNEVSINL